MTCCWHPSSLPIPTGSVDESSCFEVWNLRKGSIQQVGKDGSHGFRVLCLVIKQTTTVITGWWLKTEKSSLPGETIEFDEHLFQTGWFNLQLDKHTMFRVTTSLTHHDSVKSGTLVWQKTRVVDSIIFFRIRSDNIYIYIQVCQLATLLRHVLI